MVQDIVSSHFVAAVGVERQFEKAAEAHLFVFYMNALRQYRREIKFERARLLRRNPFDYRAVRRLDRELEDVILHLREMDFRQRSV